MLSYGFLDFLFKKCFFFRRRLIDKYIDMLEKDILTNTFFHINVIKTHLLSFFYYT
jgi:hypothetical protein